MDPRAARTAARLGAGEAEWRDWRWQVRHALTDAGTLGARVALTDAERRGLALAAPRP